MRGFRIASMVVGVFVAGLATSSLSTKAEAGFRWDWRLRGPQYEVFQDQEYYEDDGSFDDGYYEEDEPVVRKKRRTRKQELWWTEDESDFQPIYEPPPRRVKKKIVARLQPKAPLVKTPAKLRPASEGEPLTDISVARKKFGKKPELQVAVLEPVVKPITKAKPKAKVVTPKPRQVASLDKQDKILGKSIGCTAGAGVVTGYGFGAVRPKVCTGATYAYDAARGGKNYLIRLNAASGEILEVKRLN